MPETHSRIITTVIKPHFLLDCICVSLKLIYYSYASPCSVQYLHKFVIVAIVGNLVLNGCCDGVFLSVDVLWV